MKKWIILIITCLIIPVRPVFSKDEIQLLKEYEIVQPAFIQGLEIYQEDLYLGTGLYGESYLGTLDLDSGKIEVLDPVDQEYFGEGITFTPNYLWQLTWREGVALKRDLENFDIIESVPYQGEGWGIAYDQDNHKLWMSNGSSTIYERDPETFKITDSFTVSYQGQEINQLNELEYHDGFLYSNIWYSTKIIAINIETQFVEGVFDFAELIQDNFTEEELQTIDSLNGIAHKEDNIFYVTGKRYPKIFEVELSID